MKRELALHYIKELKDKNDITLKNKKISFRDKINTNISSLQLMQIETLILLNRITVTEPILQDLERMEVEGVQDFMEQFDEKRSGVDRRQIDTMINPDKERRKSPDRRLTSRIEKMKIDDGDFIIVRMKKINPKIKDTMKKISDLAKKRGAYAIFANYETRIEKFDEKIMFQIGWVRKDQLEDEDVITISDRINKQ